MRLHLLVFGKLKTPGLRDAADHYLSHAKSWVQFVETELKPIAVPDKSPATRKTIQKREGELLLEKLGRTPFYLLDETGRPLATQDWAKLVRGWESEGSQEVALCIGSSLGFSDDVRARARGVLSLGPQTLAHELARVVLLEQLFRAWSVVRGHPYHNDGKR